MTPPAVARPAVLLVLALGLATAGCARSGGEYQATAAARAACRQHADAVYTMRNPEAVYRADSAATASGAPFSGGALAGGISSGLSGQYVHDQMVSDCLRGSHGTVGAAPDAPTPQ